MATPQMPPLPGATVMTDTLDFVKNLWGSMAVPGMNLPGLAVPTLSVEDLDKKISDLKAVEAWLNVNMSMLRGTIQALEVQRGTIATLKSMGATFAAAMQQPGATEKSMAQAAPYASAFFQQAGKTAPAKPATGAKPATNGNPTSNTSADAGATPMTNPAAWWNLLQDQFQQAVTTAMAIDPLAPAAAKAGADQPKPGNSKA